MSTFFERRTALIWASVMLALLLALIIALMLDSELAFSLTLVGLGAIIILFAKPKWLFYLFMLFFVFGEVDFGEFFLRISFSNFFGVFAIGIIFVYGFIDKHRILTLLRSPRVKLFWKCLLLLFFWQVISAILNNAYRPLTTSLSHIISVLFVFLIARNRSVLSKGFVLGMISVGILSTFTILTGLGINPVGYRAPISWGSAPWESFIPRSIGLPNMKGGLHSVYILAFLPLAILLATNIYKLKLSLRIRFLGGSVTVLGILALLFASYRSGWLGLVVCLGCLAWLKYRTTSGETSRKIFMLLILLCLGAIFISQFAGTIYNELYNLIFAIRSQGVNARVTQYQFVVEKMLIPSIHLVFGYGFEDFGNSFTAYVASGNLNNPELNPWLHNYFLGELYAIGWPGLIMFGFLILIVLRRLYYQSRSDDVFTRVMSTALFSSLCGIFIALAFTAETSGLHIIWILMSSSFLLENGKQGNGMPWSSFLLPTSNTQHGMAQTYMLSD